MTETGQNRLLADGVSNDRIEPKSVECCAPLGGPLWRFKQETGYLAW